MGTKHWSATMTEGQEIIEGRASLLVGTVLEGDGSGRVRSRRLYLGTACFRRRCTSCRRGLLRTGPCFLTPRGRFPVADGQPKRTGYETRMAHLGSFVLEVSADFFSRLDWIGSRPCQLEGEEVRGSFILPLAWCISLGQREGSGHSAKVLAS